MSERPPKVPDRSHVVWVPLERSQFQPAQPVVAWSGVKPDVPAKSLEASAASRPVAPRAAVRPPEPSQSEQLRASSREGLSLVPRPDELPGMMYFHGSSGKELYRAQTEDWHGNPVILLATGRGESLAIAPSLEPEDRTRPHICQDRAAFEYGSDGRLKGFAVADGVSTAFASASVADHLVRIAAPVLSHLAQKFTKVLQKKDVVQICRNIEERLRARVDKDALIADLERDRKVHPDFLKGDIDDVRRGHRIGSATLLAGMVRPDVYPDTNEPCERVTMIRIGDGGQCVVGPYPRSAAAAGDFAPAGRAPAQINPGREAGVPEDSIETEDIFLRSREILLVFTDGLQKAGWKTIAAFQKRAQELYDEGYTDPDQLTRRLIWESKGKGDAWLDDTTIFAHQAH